MLVSRRALVCALALSPLASAQGTVWTVDDDSPADFVELQPAINAASDGDLILLRPGVYQSASIDAKSLTLQVDGAPGSVEVNGLVSIFGYVPPALSISNIAAHQSVTIRGLRANAWGFSIPDLVVSVGACQGPVLFEDCEFVNGAGDAVSISGCDSVTFVRSTLDPGSSFYYSYQSVYFPRVGLSANTSSVYFYDSEVLGSLGVDAMTQLFSYLPPGAGGRAAALSDVRLYAWGTSFVGGPGGSAESGTCDAGADGGNGIDYDGLSTVRLMDSVTAGGVGGSGTCGLGDGVAGVPTSGPANKLILLPGSARSLAASSPVTEGTQIDLASSGVPGDDVFLLIGLEPTAGVYYDVYAAVQHLAPPFVGVNLGAVPASGTLDTVFPLPNFGPGFDFARYPAQALFVTPGAEVYHAGPSTVVIKAAGF